MEGMGTGKLAAVCGLALGVASVAMASVYPAMTLSIASLALAGVLLMAWAAYRDFGGLWALSRKRSTHMRANNLVMIASVVFIVVLINLIARQYYLRLDCSTAGRFTLAPQSRAVADSVDDVVTLRYFGVEGGRESVRMRELMESYRYINRSIVYELHDLDRSPVLAAKYGIKDYDSIVAESAGGVYSARGSDEQAVTNLLIRATRHRHLKVRYVVGHGEPDLDSQGRSGYSRLAHRVRSMGYEFEPLAPAVTGQVPKDTDVLIIAAPTAGLSAAEMESFARYMEGGGKLLLLVDGPGPLDALLASMGLQVLPWPIYDTRNLAGSDPSSPLVDRYMDTPITAGFTLSTMFPGVYEVARTGRHTGFTFTPFAQASRDSWYEKNGNATMDEGESEGNNDFAGIVSSPQMLMKAVVFGDSDFVSNAYYAVEGNVNLLLNALNWLAGEGMLTSVAPQSRRVVPMYITDEQARVIRLMAGWGIPFVILAAGVAVWLRRRSL